MKSIVSYPAGTLPRAAALADLDGDGDLDVALTAEGPARVLVLYNTGGVLSTGPALALGLPSRIGRLAAADLDGDGDIDLAATHREGTLVLVENVGGALSIRSSMGLSSAPDDIVAGDLDGDGDFDLVVTGEYGGELHALWNHGGFTFAAQSYTMPLGTASLSLGRVTGSGALDVAVACTGSDQVLVFTPTYLQGWRLVGLPPVQLDHVYPQDISVGDVDGNGFADLVAVGLTYQGFTLGRAQVVLSHGGGGFQKLPSFWPKPGPVGTCALGDLDNDGDLDLALGGIINDTVAVLVNSGGGVYSAPPTVFTTDYSGFDLDAADLDGDGGVDLVELFPDSGRVWVLLNAAGATPAEAKSYCTAKVNSSGGTATAGSSGVPSFGSQGFALRLDGALPGGLSIGIWGSSGPASLPFANGFLCVQAPILRLTPQQLSATGSASVAVPIAAAMIGTTRWYQWWYRDPGHPDGTGVGLSDGLAVTFSG